MLQPPAGCAALTRHAASNTESSLALLQGCFSCLLYESLRCKPGAPRTTNCWSMLHRAAGNLVVPCVVASLSKLAVDHLNHVITLHLWLLVLIQQAAVVLQGVAGRHSHQLLPRHCTSACLNADDTQQLGTDTVTTVKHTAAAAGVARAGLTGVGCAPPAGEELLLGAWCAVRHAAIYTTGETYAIWLARLAILCTAGRQRHTMGNTCCT